MWPVSSLLVLSSGVACAVASASIAPGVPASTASETATQSTAQPNGQTYQENPKGLSTSDRIRAGISRESLRARGTKLQQLTEEAGGDRFFIRQKGYKSATDWVEKTLESEAHGFYKIERKPVQLWGYPEGLRLTVEGKEVAVLKDSLNIELPSSMPTYTEPPFETGEKVFKLVKNHGCRREDWPEGDLSQNIVLLRAANTTTLATFMDNQTTDEPYNDGKICDQVTALGVRYPIVAEKGDEYEFPGALAPVAAYIPIYQGESLGPMISNPYYGQNMFYETDGLRALYARLEKGEEVRGNFFDRTAHVDGYQIVATTKSGDQNNVVHVGGAVDSELPGPAMNVAGSAAVTMLEVAVQLAKQRQVNNAIRFSWWVRGATAGSGRLGSDQYTANLTAEESEATRFYLNLQFLASPNYRLGVMDVGAPLDAEDQSDPLATHPRSEAQNASIPASKLLRDFFQTQHNLTASRVLPSQTDAGLSFLTNNIPYSGLDGGASSIALWSNTKGWKTPEEARQFGGKVGEEYDPNFGFESDNLGALNMDAWFLNTDAVGYFVGTCADSLTWMGPKPKSNGKPIYQPGPETVV